MHGTLLQVLIFFEKRLHAKKIAFVTLCNKETSCRHEKNGKYVIKNYDAQTQFSANCKKALFFYQWKTQ